MTDTSWTARCYVAYATGNLARIEALLAEAEAANDTAGIEVCRAWRGDFIPEVREFALWTLINTERMVA